MMSMLVEHGIVGGVYYMLLWIWIYLTVRKLRRGRATLSPLMLTLTTGVFAALAAQLIADQFVPYVRYEVRFWMFTVLMVMVNLAARGAEVAQETAPQKPDALRGYRPPSLARP
jgi:hypothetical protein